MTNITNFPPPTFPGPGTPPPAASGGAGASVGGAGATRGTDAPTATHQAPLPLPSLPSLDGSDSTASALQGPELPVVGPMQNLSASDLLQLIRKEVKQLSEALQKAQAEVIKSNQTTMVAKSQASIAKLHEACEKLAEAQKIKDAMGIFNKVMYGVMGVILALCTPLLACMPPMAVLAWGAYAAYITVNEKDNGKMMEDIMNKISEDWGVAWADEGIEKQRENGMITFTSVMAAVQILIAIITIIATWGGGTPAVAGSAATTAAAQATVAAGQAATQAAAAAGATAASTASTAASTAATTAASAAATASTSAVTTATTTATSTATAAASTAASTTGQTVGNVLSKLASLVSITTTLGTSGAKIAGGVYDYEGTMLKADAEDLKAHIKFLQALLQSETDLLQQLVRIQADLDKGVAGILNDEHRTNQQLQQVTHFS